MGLSGMPSLLSYAWSSNLGGPAQNPTPAWSRLSVADVPKIWQDSLYRAFSSLTHPLPCSLSYFSILLP